LAHCISTTAHAFSCLLITRTLTLTRRRPISFQLGLEDRSRYTFGGAFAVAAASSAAAAGGVGQAYLPLATFKGHGWGSCSHCTFDASSVSEIDIYNLFQVGPFAATIRAVEAVAAPQQHTWTDPGLAARFGQPGAIAAELKGTIARGGYVYDKGYPHLCTALYAHTASVLISAASASGGVNGWESSVATATPGAAGVPGTQSAATQALCNALSFARCSYRVWSTAVTARGCSSANAAPAVAFKPSIRVIQIALPLPLPLPPLPPPHHHPLPL
jgi:hypothetical protein